MIEIADSINEQIGYGTLGTGDDHDYTVSVKVAIPESHHWSVIQDLEYQVANAIKVWLLYQAPAGTRTAIACAIEE